MSKEEAGEAVPAAQRSSWTSFLKSIASVSGDLSSMTAPPFILSPTSLTEFPAYWCERPELFGAIADAKNGHDRILAVTRWFISTLKSQYTTRNETMGSEKKPLNPVLGETFYGIWPATATSPLVTLLVEQVSHHPPITAYRIAAPAKGLVLVGSNAQKTSFSGGSIGVKQVGHAVLTYTSPSGAKDEYLITFPRLRIDGLWYGSPYIELADSSYIASSDGWVTSVEYKGKGYFSGKSHSFKATIQPPYNIKGSPYVVEGTWHTTSTVNATKETFHDVTSHSTPVQARPVSEQEPYESRKLWAVVAQGIREGDFDTAARDKSRIENEQRELRKREKEEGTSWVCRHYKHVDQDEIYSRLVGPLLAGPFGKEAIKFIPIEEDGWVPNGTMPEWLKQAEEEARAA